MAIKSLSTVTPYVYCYSTPGVTYHEGWVKIGYTEQDVFDRIPQQTKTAGIRTKIEWFGVATYDSDESISFTDDDFKAFLLEKGVENVNEFGDDGESIGDEWYKIEAWQAKKYFDEFKKAPTATVKLKAYKLRMEQQDAVKATTERKDSGEDKQFLWNAKPRFGKCLSCYEFIKTTNARKVLIVTNKPAVATSWYDDYEKFLGRESGYFFVSHVSEITGKPLVINYNAYAADEKSRESDPEAQEMGLIYFVSLQDIKGSTFFGGDYPKLKELTTITFDLLVVDESHEGVATYKTEAAFNRINRAFTLYLSGTPFKAIKDETFDTESIYNWTYVSEQEAKLCWDGNGTNPYFQMPRLNMLTYRLSHIIGELPPDLRAEDDDAEEGTGLNEFFKVANGKFVHDADIDLFLDTISSDPKYPFGSEQNRSQLAHTFWLLSRVEAAKLLERKLNKHEVFGNYKVVLAAGDGKTISDNDEDEIVKSTRKSYLRVVEAIENYDRTITLSVGQLTTGVTIPQWSGIMMLSERDSAAEYMQASFRAQNPYIFHKTNPMTGRVEHIRKTDAYVFDFNPEHTLDIVEQFANNLYSETANGKGDYEERRGNIEKLLKYLPVTGESEEGSMELLTPDNVILIPRKMRSQEVVRRGFMCDMLFQNITNVFRITANGMDIVSKMPIFSQPDRKPPAFTVTEEEVKDMHLDEHGDVNVTEEDVKKIVEETVTKEEKEEAKKTAVEEVRKVEVSATATPAERKSERKELVDAFKQAAQAAAVAKAQEESPDIASKSMIADLKRAVGKAAEDKAQAIYSDYIIEANTKENAVREEMAAFTTPEDQVIVEQMVAEVREEAKKKFDERIIQEVEDFMETSTFEITAKRTEEAKAQKAKNTKLDEFKKRLKGFTRTIPSFLMAYGCDDFTLKTVEEYIPGDVFEEVTSITLEEFKVLRDDCKYFDPIVFNDSVQVFLKKRRDLSHYFEDTAKEDIFDYIPPQKTNQIYTPKAVVKMMVDMLETENPGCFDQDDKTFIDLYMKSGLFVAEIVKRLFQSENLKSLYPDKECRLKHIFEKQVYGLAPTEIIFRIASNFVLGFDEDIKIEHHNLRKLDALPYAKNGTLEKKLDEIFER